MAAVVIALGAVAVAVVWRLVARGVATVWGAMSVVLAVAAVVALLAEDVHLSRRIAPVVATLAGAGIGLGLYVATRVFVRLVARFPAFAHHTADVYGERHDVSLAVALFLALAVVAPAEEAFWRGFVQARLGDAMSPLAGALAAWGLYVAANLASGKLPIVAAAVVGGAVWGGLAFWTRGVLASVACHVVWAGLMILLPPPEAASREVSA